MSTIGSSPSPAPVPLSRSAQDLEDARGMFDIALKSIPYSVMGHLAWSDNPEASIFDRKLPVRARVMDALIYFPLIGVSTAMAVVGGVTAGVLAAKAGVEALLDK